MASRCRFMSRRKRPDYAARRRAPDGDDGEPIPPTPGEDEVIVDGEPPDITIADGGERPRKVYVDGVGAAILAERVEYLDENGKLVTETLRDFTKKALKKRFASLDDFLKRWKSADRKQAIIEELEDEGLSLDPLAEELGRILTPSTSFATSLSTSCRSPEESVRIDEAAKLVLQEPGRTACHLFHAGPVDLAGFVQRNGEGFGGGFDVVYGAVTVERPAFEDGGLGGAFGVGIVSFEREKKRVIGVARESLDVLLRG